MRILFDQGTPVGIRRGLVKHYVRTAAEQCWSALRNGELLGAAEKALFDVLVTTDTDMPYQQNLTGRKLAVVVLSRNRWDLVKDKLPEIASAVEAATPGTWSVVEI